MCRDIRRDLYRGRCSMVARHDDRCGLLDSQGLPRCAACMLARNLGHDWNDPLHGAERKQRETTRRQLSAEELNEINVILNDRIRNGYLASLDHDELACGIL